MEARCRRLKSAQACDVSVFQECLGRGQTGGCDAMACRSSLSRRLSAQDGYNLCCFR